MSLSEDKKFYILINGLKEGPFSKEELQEKLDQKEILYTHQVSFDKGHNYDYLYNIESFERRIKNRSEELPHSPTSNIFQEDAKLIKNDVLHKDHTAIDATVALAHIGNVSGSGKNSGNSTKKINLNKYKDQLGNSGGSNNTVFNSENKKNKYDYMWAVLLIFSLVGLKVLYSDQTSKKNTRSLAQIAKQKKRKIKTSLKKKAHSVTKKTKKNFYKKKKLPAQSKPKVKSISSSKTSFYKSKNFNNAKRPRKKLSNNPTRIRYENNNRYPAEQHPQKRKLSKETLAPIDDYDNMEDQQYDDNGDPIVSKGKKKQKVKNSFNDNDEYNDFADENEENHDASHNEQKHNQGDEETEEDY